MSVLTITICVGSSCSVRGSDELAAALEQLIAQHGKENEVELIGSFCMGECSRGVSICVGERQYREIMPEHAESFFSQAVLPHLASGDSEGSS
jgi:NADH:ubiquinone oxidoreductase subunit E